MTNGKEAVTRVSVKAHLEDEPDYFEARRAGQRRAWLKV
jgi:hypothetical protein